MVSVPKSALITGVSGQDGAILADCLLKKGWRITGWIRSFKTSNLWRLEELGVKAELELREVNLRDADQTRSELVNTKPDRIFHLGGESHVGKSFDDPAQVFEVNVIGTLNILDTLRTEIPQARFFYPSSSEIFAGHQADTRINEEATADPISPYGVSRLAAQNLVAIFRRRYDLFATCGIMFNHESQYRGANFVTRKITQNLARLKLHGGEPMLLGNFDAGKDWGSAIDYMRAVADLLEEEAPGDFIFATGHTSTIRHFLGMAARFAGFAPEFSGHGEGETCIDAKSGLMLAKSSKEFFRPLQTPPLKGDPAKLVRELEHFDSRSLENIAQEMIEADIRRLSKKCLVPLEA